MLRIFQGMPTTRLDMQPGLANRYGAGITVLTVLKDTYSSHDMSVIDLIIEENILTIGEADKQEIMSLGFVPMAPLSIALCAALWLEAAPGAFDKWLL